MKTNSEISKVLEVLGIEELNKGVCTGTVWPETGGDRLTSYSPADGQPIADIKQADLGDYESVVKLAGKAFMEWRLVPAPRRGEIIRQIGLEVRKFKEPLGKLVSWEMGKITGCTISIIRWELLALYPLLIFP